MEAYIKDDDDDCCSLYLRFVLIWHHSTMQNGASSTHNMPYANELRDRGEREKVGRKSERDVDDRDFNKKRAEKSKMF